MLLNFRGHPLEPGRHVHRYLEPGSFLETDDVPADRLGQARLVQQAWVEQVGDGPQLLCDYLP